MKTTTILVSLIAFLGAGIDTVVSAACCGPMDPTPTCFGGEIWDDRALARTLAERECKQGAFQGAYGPGQVKSICLPFTSRQSVTFSVENRRTVGPRDLFEQECVLGLNKVINSCDRGGQVDEARWLFTADPTDGIIC
jgi:hypothetical protein